MIRPEPNPRVAELAERAAVAPRHLIEPFFKEAAKEVLLGLARNPNLREPDLLRLLDRKDLAAEVVREIAAHREGEKSYAVKLSLVRHPRTPRMISLPLMKFLYLFDLVRVTQTPAVPSDVKLAAEDMILKKLDAVPRGEKITLARRSSGRVAAGILVSRDAEIVRAALDNPFLTEAHVLRILSLENLPREVVAAITAHDKWSRRYHLRLALIRNPLTPLTRVLEFLPDLAVTDLREICADRRMPDQVRHYVLAHCAERLGKK